jgi:hypothetical protein
MPWPNDPLVFTVVAMFGVAIPAAVLAGRFAVKWQRQATLDNLRQTLTLATRRDAALIPSFEFALQKYDVDGNPGKGWRRAWWRELLFYALSAIIFTLLSIAGFVFLLDYKTMDEQWTTPSFLFSGVADLADPKAVLGYQRATAAVISFAFLGAYVWSITYLIRRISNFDLSPMSFLRVSAQIILACATATILRHVLSSFAGDGFAADVLPLAAFLIGFNPVMGLDYLIQKMPQLRLKSADKDAAEAFRSMPLEMVDGIDSQVSFRLAEREVTDIQTLAAENPILLCAESPYPLATVLDWIGQAQLALEAGPKAYKRLRDVGIRTVFALDEASRDKDMESVAIKALYESNASGPKELTVRLAVMKANPHVFRLFQIRDVVRDADNDAAKPPRWEAPDRAAHAPLAEGAAEQSARETTPPLALVQGSAPPETG